MPLTRAETRKLESISRTLHESDPALARALAAGRPPRRWLSICHALAFPLCVLALVLGIAVPVPLLCAFAWVQVIALLVLGRHPVPRAQRLRR